MKMYVSDIKTAKQTKYRFFFKYLQYIVNFSVINCKKLRFYNRFTIDFTVVGGQIGCPYFTVFFLQCTYVIFKKGMKRLLLDKSTI